MNSRPFARLFQGIVENGAYVVGNILAGIKKSPKAFAVTVASCSLGSVLPALLTLKDEVLHHMHQTPQADSLHILSEPGVIASVFVAGPAMLTFAHNIGAENRRHLKPKIDWLNRPRADQVSINP